MFMKGLAELAILRLAMGLRPLLFLELNVASAARQRNNSIMTNEIKMPQAMVVLANESLWPILSMVVHCQSRPEGLQRVLIYHTAQPVESLIPASRLRYLLNSLFPEIEVKLPENLGAGTPSDVQAQIERWMQDHPGAHWMLLGSGSTGPMELGLLGFVGRPNIEVIGPGGPGLWCRWDRPAGQEGIVLQPLDGCHPSATDALPIEALLKSQVMTSDKAPVYTASTAEDLPVRRLTDLGAANGWDWASAFKQCGLDTSATPAAFFVRYLAAALGELGISNLAHTIRLSPQADARDKNDLEMDLVFNARGRLVILDAKLDEALDEEHGGAQPIPRQIQLLAGVRRRLSALSTRVVMLRPCRVFSEMERAMAQALEIDVMDQSEAPKFFSRLAALLKWTQLPETLAEIEKLLVELVSLRGRRRVFGPESKLTREQESLSGTPVLVDIEKHLDRVCAERGQNWILWMTRSQVILRLAKPAAPPPQMALLIQNGLKRFGRVQVGETPTGYEAFFPRNDALLGVLRQAFAGYVNRSLDPMIFIQAAPAIPQPPRRPLPASALAMPTGDFLNELDNVMDQAADKPAPRTGKR